jgi:hypothetical protein
MSFRLSSVIPALGNHEELEYDSPVPVCPRPGGKSCQKPELCDMGIHRQCKQKLSVFTNGCLRHLYFYFIISSEDHDGMINERDSQLNILIREGMIDKTVLQRVL